MLERRTYRIHTVSEVTGIPAATLRAWERRYGFPKPLRTESRYRLYSDTNIAQVRRMKELISSGMAPSEAAQLILESEVPVVAQPAEEPADPFTAAAQRLADSAKSMEPRRIEEEVRFALALGDALSVVERVFCPAMRTVGEYWEQGVISVGHEHLASEIVTLATRDLLRLMAPAAPRQRALLACFAEEQHVLPMYAAAFRFVQLGLGVEVLGSRTPPVALGAAVRNLEPHVVGISITMAPAADAAETLLEGYAKAAGDRPWLVGGAAVEHVRGLVEGLGGHAVCGGGEAASLEIARLLKVGRR